MCLSRHLSILCGGRNEGVLAQVRKSSDHGELSILEQVRGRESVGTLGFRH